VAYIQGGILSSSKEEWNYRSFLQEKMDGTGDRNVEWDKLSSKKCCLFLQSRNYS
jgi:hypothetical protein